MVFWTVFSGVLVYVLGQWTVKVVIEPGHEFRKTVADLSHTLLMYANLYGCGKQEDLQLASLELRSLSARLHAHMYLVNGITSRVYRLPERSRVYDAAKELIGLSNSVYGPRCPSPAADVRRGEVISARVKRICDALGIHNPEV